MVHELNYKEIGFGLSQEDKGQCLERPYFPTSVKTELPPDTRTNERPEGWMDWWLIR